MFKHVRKYVIIAQYKNYVCDMQLLTMKDMEYGEGLLVAKGFK